MTQIERLLLDTNVLVYAMDGSSEFHAVSRAVLDRAQSPDAGLCVTPQNMVEFYSLVTNPRRVLAPRSPEEAIETVESLMAFPGLDVLPVPFDLVSRVLALCKQHTVMGTRIFDLQIVAVMQANGVQRISTFDRTDFEPFSDISVEMP